MRIMCIGDVVGSVGCEFLRQRLPRFKQQQQIDFVICNGENSADGNGITPRSAEHLFTSGVDFITLGNHSFRRKEVYPYLDEHPHIIRPANYPTSATPGCGWAVVDMGFTSIGVINLMGQQFMDANLDNPFIRADQIHGLLSGWQSIRGVRHAYSCDDRRRAGAAERYGLYHRRRHDGRDRQYSGREEGDHPQALYHTASRTL